MESEIGQEPQVDAGAVRSMAQLNMLHSLAAQLNALGSVPEIGAAIAAELRTILDFHNCRVYVLESDARTLTPVAFRGDLSEATGEYRSETLEELITVVGEGITGHVAASGTSILTPNAQELDFAVQIEGTDDIVESMLVVPMKRGSQVVGVIVLSSLGYGRFDDDDRRVLEVLASHAAIAIENARLLQGERASGERSAELQRLSQSLIGLQAADDILRRALEAALALVPACVAGAYVRKAGSGSFRLVALESIDGTRVRPRADIADVPGSIADAFLTSYVDPFTVPVDVVEQMPRDLFVIEEVREGLAAPLRWDPDGTGVIMLQHIATDGRFDPEDLRITQSVADITSLALGNARRLSELERFSELMESLDAVFWEADGETRAFTFMGGRVTELLGPGAAHWVRDGVTWGAHIAPDDREVAMSMIERDRDTSIEYRVETYEGRSVWLRDLIHMVPDAKGPRQLRGLMVDATERKRAEDALRRSERKYSDAFIREREASQRLRALDDMKNTFLEAVSHDLRTPLTAILGSALTLEQSRLDLPPEDAIDLVHRIATNARKLERLLSDLLDLDRLQRGIVSPQRRPIRLAQLVQRGVGETENPSHRSIEVAVEDATVSVDAAKVERILENLLSNALRHTPADAKIWVRASSQDGGMMLIVEDEGPGVPEDLHEAIFEPFRQAPGSESVHSPGVGVGLSLVLRFAELHGGRAWVEDRPGGGSRFSVSLPGG